MCLNFLIVILFIIILVDIGGIEPPHKVELTQSKCRVKPLCLFDKSEVNYITSLSRKITGTLVEEVYDLYFSKQFIVDNLSFIISYALS